MIIKSQDDIKYLKEIGKIVAITRDKMLEAVVPGITTLELDEIGTKLLKEFGANSAPRVMYNFPGTTCISLNDEVCHGIPGTRIVKEGDMINIDVSAELNGYFSDTGATKLVQPSNDKVKTQLIEISKLALESCLTKITANKKINEIGKEISRVATSNGYKVIKNLCGHGIGRKLHEEPEYIENYYKKTDKRVLKEGHVLAVETFISTVGEYVVEESDGWTMKTTDGSLVAQFEHSIIVTKDSPIILTV